MLVYKLREVSVPICMNRVCVAYKLAPSMAKRVCSKVIISAGALMRVSASKFDASNLDVASAGGANVGS